MVNIPNQPTKEERQKAADAANKAAAEAQAKQLAGSGPGGLGVGGFGGKHHTIELTENLGISGGVGGSIKRAPPSSSPAQDTISSGKTRAQVQVAQREIQSKQTSISAQRAATEQKLKAIDAAIAARPPPRQEKYGSAKVIGGRMHQKYRTVTDPEAQRLMQQRQQLQNQLRSLTQQESELQNQSGQLFVMEREATKQQAQSASLEQLETRQKYMSKAAEARARQETQRQEMESKTLASAYNWRKPSAYHVEPSWLVPGAIEESSRQNVLSVVASDQPEAARQSRSLYATYKDVAPKTFFEESELGVEGTRTHYTLGLTEDLSLDNTISGGVRQEKYRQARQEYLTTAKDFFKKSQQQGFTLLRITDQSGTRDIPIQTGYRELLKSGNGLAFDISPKDPLFEKYRKESKQFRAGQKEYIAQAKKLGFEKIAIKTDAGYKVVPVEFAYREVVKAGPTAELTITPTDPSIGRQLISQDILSQTIYKLETEPEAKKDVGKNIVLEGLAFASSFGTLLKTGRDKLFEAVGQPELKEKATSIPDFYQPRTVGAEGSNVFFTMAGQAAKSVYGFFTGQKAKPVTESMQTVKSGEGFTKFWSGLTTEQKIGQSVGFGLAFIPRRAIPIQYQKLPITTAEGTATAARLVAIGTESKNILLTGKTPSMAKFDIPAGTRGLEQGAYTPLQLKSLRSGITELEKQGVVKSGTVETSTQIEAEIARQRGLPWIYKKELPEQPVSSLTKTETKPVLEAIAKQQELKRLEAFKGSLISLQREGGKSRPIHDIDLQEMKPSLAEKASAEIVQTQVDPGRTLGLSGVNIVVGEIDPTRAITATKTATAGVPPTIRYGVKPGTEKEVINIVRQKEPKQPQAAGSAFSSGKVFGKDYPKETYKFKIQESEKKLKGYGAPYQATAKGISITAFQSAKSLADVTTLTKTQQAKILGGAKLAMFPAGWREKDVVDFYMQTLDAASVAQKAGLRKQALESGKTARTVREYYSGIDWQKAIREYRPSFEIGATPQPATIKESVYGVTRQGVPQLPRVQPLSVYGERKESPTNKIVKPKSPTGIISPASAMVKSPVRSPVTSAAVIRSPMRSAYTKSPTVKSIMSPSGSMPSPAKLTYGSPRAPSPTSPRSPPKSPFSPYIPRSPSIGSPPRSPSPPKSPPRTSPPRSPPKSPPLLRMLTPPSPPRPVRLLGVTPPFIKSRVSEGKRKKPNIREDFFGSTHEATILGMRDIVKKGRDFDYGDIKTAKLVEKDIALTSKGRAKFLISKKPDLISRSKKGLRVEPKKINWGKRTSWM